MEKTTLKISGMHCASCSTIIEKTLEKKEWIQSISVSLASNSANIAFDENKTNINEISKQINDLWYKIVEKLDNNEQKKYFQKFLYSLILSLFIASTMFVDIREIFGYKIMFVDAILLILGAIVVFVIWWNFHVWFIQKLKNWQANMDTLISIGTSIAWFFSLYSFIQIYFFDNMIHFYHFLEWAVFIVTFICLGKYLELKSKWNASSAIQKLMQLQEKEAIILKDNKEIKVSIDDIKLWDIVVVRAWDKISVDGIISKWQSSINESMLTWESIPVNKQEWDEVFSGTIVEDGFLNITVNKDQSETMLAKIIQTVNEAQNSKAPIQHTVDKISSIFVPIILVIALLAFVWRYLYSWDAQNALLIMVATIVIACPCAMWLATPIAIVVATGTGASRWILIKWWEVLEKSKNIDAVVFDKTWTLTEWKPSITDIISLDDNTEEFINDICYSLAKNSNHPLSKAIVENKKKNTNPNQIEITDFQEIAWKWLAWKLKNEVIAFWNKKLLDLYNIEPTTTQIQEIEELQSQGKTVNFVVKSSSIIGYISFLDQIKSTTIKWIQALQKMWIKTIMISWDTTKTVQAIAWQIWIDKRYAQVYPQQKADIVKELQSQDMKIAFVWDGINDAPALAQSDLWIAIWQWTDVAIETAQMVLVNSDPYKVVEAIKLAKKTYLIIKQNLFWAFAYNAILVPIAAFWLLLPVFASLAMSLSSVSVVVNSLRLKRI